MKIMIFIVALTIPLMAGIQAKGQDARQDLNAAQKNTNAVVQKVATAEEWKTFNKSEFELKIKENEMRIIELNIKIRKTAELFDAFYLKKITDLEQENRFLKARLEAYEKSLSKMGSN